MKRNSKKAVDVMNHWIVRVGEEPADRIAMNNELKFDS